MGRFITPLTAADIQLDKSPILFGKYRGHTPEEVYETDPSYLVWAFDTIKNRPICSKNMRDAAKDASSENYEDKISDAYSPLDPLNDLEF